MSDEEAILRTKGGTPGFDLNIHAGLGHVDGALAAFPVAMSIGGFPFLVSPPAQLGGLIVALGNEAVNGPGIPELSLGPPSRSGLGVSLCDVNALDSKVHHKESPFLLCLGLRFQREGDVLCKVEECLFGEPADHARVGPAAGDSSRFKALFANFLEEGLSEAVVASLFEVDFFVGVEALPFLLDCVDVEDALPLAVEHYVGR